MCDTLENINKVLNNEDKGLLLISSLPKSYKYFVDTSIYERQTLSLDEVKSVVNMKEL